MKCICSQQGCVREVYVAGNALHVKLGPGDVHAKPGHAQAYDAIKEDVCGAGGIIELDPNGIVALLRDLRSALLDLSSNV